MENKKIKNQKVWINVIIKIVLALSLSWPIWYNAQSFYNVLPFMSEGMVMLEMLSVTAQKIMFTVIIPILSTAMMFGLVMLIEIPVANGIERNMRAFGKEVDKNWHKKLVEITAIGLALSKGLLETILSLYPLSANVTRPIVSILLDVIFLGLFYLAVLKKDSKEMFPFLFKSLMFPTILVVIIV